MNIKLTALVAISLLLVELLELDICPIRNHFGPSCEQSLPASFSQSYQIYSRWVDIFLNVPLWTHVLHVGDRWRLVWLVVLRCILFHWVYVHRNTVLLIRRLSFNQSFADLDRWLEINLRKWLFLQGCIVALNLSLLHHSEQSFHPLEIHRVFWSGGFGFAFAFFWVLISTWQVINFKECAAVFVRS